MNLVNYYMSELYIICNKNCILIQYHYRYVHSSIDLNYTCDNNSDWSVCYDCGVTPRQVSGSGHIATYQHFTSPHCWVYISLHFVFSTSSITLVEKYFLVDFNNHSRLPIHPCYFCSEFFRVH